MRQWAVQQMAVRLVSGMATQGVIYTKECSSSRFLLASNLDWISNVSPDVSFQRRTLSKKRQRHRNNFLYVKMHPY